MPIRIQHNASLLALSTFRLPATARERVDLDQPGQIEAALDTALPTLMLGGGSNTLFVDDFSGRIIVNRLKGIHIEADGQDVLVTAAAGENWHDLVLWSLNHQLWGIENLALIPGSVGAAPMQNIGAYGVELADCLDSVQVFDRQQTKTRWLNKDACKLGYRDSRFKSAEADRFIILAVRLRLSKQPAPALRYPALQQQLNRQNITQFEDPGVIAQAVMQIRQRKLPDPAELANAGSFFKNPIVATTTAAELLEQYPDLPHWPHADQIKLSAGWMIDQLGWRGKSIGDVQVYPEHALVLTNRGQATRHDLLALVQSIQRDVQENYAIELEPEPRLIYSE